MLAYKHLFLDAYHPSIALGCRFEGSLAFVAKSGTYPSCSPVAYVERLNHGGKFHLDTFCSGGVAFIAKTQHWPGLLAPKPADSAFVASWAGRFPDVVLPFQDEGIS